MLIDNVITELNREKYSRDHKKKSWRHDVISVLTKLIEEYMPGMGNGFKAAHTVIFSDIYF